MFLELALVPMTKSGDFWRTFEDYIDSNVEETFIICLVPNIKKFGQIVMGHNMCYWNTAGLQQRQSVTSENRVCLRMCSNHTLWSRLQLSLKKKKDRFGLVDKYTSGVMKLHTWIIMQHLKPHLPFNHTFSGGTAQQSSLGVLCLPVTSQLTPPRHALLHSESEAHGVVK